MELKVKIGINGKETDKYELQTMIADVENQELLILLKDSELNQNRLSSDV